MADELAPQDPEVEEARQLKDAVARLGASLREESERLKQDAAPDLPLPAAPRVQPDPRVDSLVDEVATLAGQVETLADLHRQAVERADGTEQQAGVDRRAVADARRRAVVAVSVAVIAVVAAIVALVVALAR